MLRRYGSAGVAERGADRHVCVVEQAEVYL